MPYAIVGILVILVLILLAASVRVVQEYERGVIFRLGRVVEGAKGPGLFFIIPMIDRMVKVNLQIVTLDVPPQDVITKDNVTVRVHAVVYFQVFQPVKATVEIQNYFFATSQLAQTTLRAVLSKVDLDDILTSPDRLSADLQRIIDDVTEPWGVKVARVEIKDVDLPVEMQRAMERQAAEVIARHPIAYQLRFLQTVGEVATEKNSTLVVPIPIELLKPFQAAFGGDGSAFTAPAPTAAGDAKTP